MDIYDKSKRSNIMSRVKGKNNKSTEQKLIDYFKANNITGWRRNYKIKGSPDFVFTKFKIAVFVDGCFWHGHDCRNTRPASNAEYWDNKISHNMQYDLQISEYLQRLGWIVIRIWECELRKKKEHLLQNKLCPLITLLSAKKE